MRKEIRTRIPATKVKQWLENWNAVEFDSKQHRRKPDEYFYVFSLAASTLRSLSGIQRRSTVGGLPRTKDTGIQRRHDKSRSEEIGRYVRFGYPWSSLSQSQQKSPKFERLRKPGWLPTAIVVNLLKAGDKRREGEVNGDDLIDVVEIDGQSFLQLPRNYKSPDWKPVGDLRPIEVIDGQHRLWAFEEEGLDSDFQLPVVAFHGLDISWQAYLFWTINIKPKRINASLAYDLYPLLRSEDWLEHAESAFVYREARAQEIVGALWGHPASPWHLHINMLGETGMERMVTQAAWIRTLTAAFVKSWEARRIPIGGLFGGRIGETIEVLPWTGAQQAAFLILVGQTLRDSVKATKLDWAKSLRDVETSKNDLAFYGHYTLLNTDQGIRGLLHVVNDIFFVRAKKLELEKFIIEGEGLASDEEDVSEALSVLRKRRTIVEFLGEVAEELSKYDWRTSSAPGLSPTDRTSKLVFRGSSGYQELRRQLIHQLSESPGDAGKAAKEVSHLLGY